MRRPAPPAKRPRLLEPIPMVSVAPATAQDEEGNLWDSDDADMVDDADLSALMDGHDGVEAAALMDGTTVVLDEKQALVVDLVKEGRNVFFSGPGGVGKSFTLGRITAALKLMYGSEYHTKVCVCAPTGIAALNVSGSTIHSATGIGVPKEVADFGRIYTRRTKVELSNGEVSYPLVWKELDVLIIDEISMLSGEFFDNLDHVLRRLRLPEGHPARPLSAEEKRDRARRKRAARALARAHPDIAAAARGAAAAPASKRGSDVAAPQVSESIEAHSFYTDSESDSECDSDGRGCGGAGVAARRAAHPGCAFGGLQLVVCGDFFQLAPIESALLADVHAELVPYPISASGGLHRPRR